MSRNGARARNGGAQTVDRACLLLTEIARHGPPGARLIDLTHRSMKMASSSGGSG